MAVSFEVGASQDPLSRIIGLSFTGPTVKPSSSKGSSALVQFPLVAVFLLTRVRQSRALGPTL